MIKPLNEGSTRGNIKNDATNKKENNIKGPIKPPIGTEDKKKKNK
jgi:hypothetical protein